MEDFEQYLCCLRKGLSLTNKLERLVEDAKSDSKLGLSAEPETIYKNFCDKTSDKLKNIEKKILVLISDSSAGLI